MKRYKYIIIVFILIIVACISYYTYAKYEVEASGVAPLEYALYILDSKPIVEDVKIGNIIPSNDSYVYAFSVSNFKDKNRLETNLEYDLKIKVTTNLPLEYRLVINDDYKTNLDNAFVKDEVIEDEDGTYFRVMEASKSNFSFKENQTNYYYLVVDFPISYIDSKYQDITEFISIEINSKQVI